MGYKRICSELIRLGCKNAHGTIEWNVDRIGRILRNATYKGYIGYNKSHSDGYLTQKRVNHRDESFVYVKGNFEPIVSEELWQTCADLRNKKSAHQRGPDGKLRKFGRKGPQSIWSSKLRCSCGSSFRRFVWHQNQDGRKTYGYECYRQKRNVSITYLKNHGLDTNLLCSSKSIPSWHIDMMAVAVFKAVWQDKKDSILLACQMIEECATKDSDTSLHITETLQSKLEKLQKQQRGLRSMCAMGDISREEFLADNQAIQTEIDTLNLQIEDIQTSKDASPSSIIDMEQIRKTLEQWMDFTRPTISEALIDQFILQVVMIDDNTYNWTLDLSNDLSSRPRPSEVALQLYRAKQHGQSEPTEVSIDTVLSRHITDPQELFSFTISQEDAATYCKSIGMKFFAKKWIDKKIIVSI